MKTTRYKFQFQNYHNFLAYKKKLKGTPYKYTEKTQKLVTSPVENIVDYDGVPFQLSSRDKTMVDFFTGLYTIEYETTLRILPV